MAERVEPSLAKLAGIAAESAMGLLLPGPIAKGAGVLVEYLASTPLQRFIGDPRNQRQVAHAFQVADEQFRRRAGDIGLSEVATLPLAGLTTLARSVEDLPRTLDGPALLAEIRAQLKADWGAHISDHQLDQLASLYLECLYRALASEAGLLHEVDFLLHEQDYLLLLQLADAVKRIETGVGDPSTAPRAVIKDIMSICTRRAIFTRTHAQIDYGAMFASLADCLAALQQKVAYVEPVELQSIVLKVISLLDSVERQKAAFLSTYDEGIRTEIDATKKHIVNALFVLERTSGIHYPLPEGLTEEVFFTREDADRSPVGPLSQA